jgi:hypothetical protein
MFHRSHRVPLCDRFRSALHGGPPDGGLGGRAVPVTEFHTQSGLDRSGTAHAAPACVPVWRLWFDRADPRGHRLRRPSRLRRGTPRERDRRPHGSGRGAAGRDANGPARFVIDDCVWIRDRLARRHHRPVLEAWLFELRAIPVSTGFAVVVLLPVAVTALEFYSPEKAIKPA